MTTTWTLSAEDAGTTVLAEGSAGGRPAAAAGLVAATRETIELLARSAGRAPTLYLQLDGEAAAVIRLGLRDGRLDVEQAYDYIDRVAAALSGDAASEVQA